MLVPAAVDGDSDLLLHRSSCSPPKGTPGVLRGAVTDQVADGPFYCATFRREMQLENSFQVSAPPDRVFAYLLDINKVVGCVPGAELTEVVDESTFKGKVKVKVGPITVAYSGTA